MTNYKLNNPIMVFYQASRAKTGRTIQMDVYDEGQALDAGKSGTMTEIGSTGRYYKVFTPDAIGWWVILMYDTVGWVKGDVVKSYKVTNEDIDSIAGKVETVETNIRGTDNDDLKTISDQLDEIGSPAMVG